MLIISFASIIIHLFSFYNKLSENITAQAHSKLKEECKQNALIVKQKINGQFTMLNSAANFVATFNSLYHNVALTAINEFVKKSDFYKMAIANASGKGITNEKEAIDISNEDFFIKSIKRTSYITKPESPLLNKDNTVYLSVPIVKNTKIQGILFGTYDISVFDDAFGNATENFGSYILASGDGKVIKTSFKEFAIPVNPGNNLFDFLSNNSAYNGNINKMITDISKNESDILMYNYIYQDFYICYTPVGVSDWYMFSLIPQSVVGDQVQLIMNEATILAVTICVSLLLFVFLLFYFKFIQIRTERAAEKENMEILKAKSAKDILTHLYNKAACKELVNNAIQNCPTEKMCAFFVIDLDGFKAVNDTMGHQYGDKLLIKSASKMKSLFRNSDIVGRFGGDEFMVFLTNISEIDLILAKAKALNEIINYEVNTGQKTIYVTASIGISIFDEDGKSYGELFEKADIALYTAKNNGKNTFVIYTEKP